MAEFKQLEKDDRTTILALSWRDIRAPKSGGAEVQTHEMLSRTNKDKFRIIHFSPIFKEAKSYEEINGIHYLRKGTIFSVIFCAMLYYLKNKKYIDFVIDQCNTHRFFTKYWVNKNKRIFYIHQLTREIWDIQAKFPVNVLGKKLETPMLRLNKNDYTIALSQSTKQNLIDVGFRPDKVFIIPIGISFSPWIIDKFEPKESNPTYIYVGRYAKYKGIDACVDAFGKVKKKYPFAKLWVLGKKDEWYVSNVIDPLCKKMSISYGGPQSNCDVILWGYVSEQEKLTLQSRAHVLLFPSVREGWGIIVTEAAAVGTPSIVYNSPGAIDAVNFGKSGYLCNENTVQELEKLMLRVIEDKEEYQKVQSNAYEFSKKFIWELNAQLFENVISQIKSKQKD